MHASYFWGRGCTCVLMPCRYTCICEVLCLFDTECLCIPCIECILLLACVSVDEASEGEEGYAGEDFAGEDQGHPEPTGKPPLDLAYMYLLYYAYALVL